MLWSRLPEHRQEGEAVDEIKRYLAGNDRSVWLTYT